MNDAEASHDGRISQWQERGEWRSQATCACGWVSPSAPGSAEYALALYRAHSKWVEMTPEQRGLANLEACRREIRFPI